MGNRHATSGGDMRTRTVSEPVDLKGSTKSKTTSTSISANQVDDKPVNNVSVALLREEGNRPISTAHEKPITNELLNKSDKKEIARIWADLKRYHPDYVKAVWLAALKQSRRFREVFCISQDQWLTEDIQEILKKPKFLRATSGMQRFLELLIVDYELAHDSIFAVATELGHRHIDHFRGTIPTALWDILTLCMVEQMEQLSASRDDEDNEDHLADVIVWRKFCNLLISYMTDAYRAATVMLEHSGGNK